MCIYSQALDGVLNMYQQHHSLITFIHISTLLLHVDFIKAPTDTFPLSSSFTTYIAILVVAVHCTQHFSLCKTFVHVALDHSSFLNVSLFTSSVLYTTTIVATVIVIITKLYM